MLLTMVGQSMPIFWVGLLMIFVFAVGSSGCPPAAPRGIRYLILPAATLALYPLARITRLVRSSLVDVLNQDYMLAARARGVSETLVVGKHALKNASLPVVTVAALQFGYMLGGAVITETIFGWPGIGHYHGDRDPASATFRSCRPRSCCPPGVFIALNLRRGPAVRLARSQDSLLVSVRRHVREVPGGDVLRAPGAADARRDRRVRAVSAAGAWPRTRPTSRRSRCA